MLFRLFSWSVNVSKIVRNWSVSYGKASIWVGPAIGFPVGCVASQVFLVHNQHPATAFHLLLDLLRGIKLDLTSSEHQTIVQVLHNMKTTHDNVGLQ